MSSISDVEGRTGRLQIALNTLFDMLYNMTQRKPDYDKVRPRGTLERSHLIRAFWKVELEPIIGRTPEGRRINTDRSEGSAKIRIDSPDAETHRRDIAFRAKAYGG
jgi:hypothetical protein